MASRTHKDWLEFLKKAAELPIGYSIDDLLYFKRIAERQYPALAPLVAACIHLAQSSDLEIAIEGPGGDSSPVAPPNTVKSAPSREGHGGNGHHPRDRDMATLLRDQRLFPKNTDLVRLATRLLPRMHQYRFDKMSRSAIIGKIVDHMETLPSRKRNQIENALKIAADESRSETASAPSFFSRWEEIIKNIEL